MPQVLAAADLVLSRSGAGTVWENATLGKPLVLLPLRGRGTRGDQVENAEFFERAGAALVLRPPAAGELADGGPADGESAGSGSAEGEGGAVQNRVAQSGAEVLAALIRELAEAPERLAAMAAAAAGIARLDGAAAIARVLEQAVSAAAATTGGTSS
jgi:UDP-N-acetylglucosamine--N-acetylmuramyl-(pentapeptide) pyrophosphoryl-undecaprenol N-acetylglucosamine transferase